MIAARGVDHERKVRDEGLARLLGKKRREVVALHECEQFVAVVIPVRAITSHPAAVQFTGAGVPSLTIKIPSRYTHGPIEVCSLKDIAATADLAAAALRAIGPGSRFHFIEC